jgi:alkanesulfonate monooxygenase SsuD/methylene tetrahydromethanopterin reductase-like flavin-dependent oxidoreductase (luciferase family)
MTAPRVDLHLTGDQVSVAEMIGYAQQAEQGGFGGVWMAEAFRDALVPLAAITCATSRVVVGSNVAQWTRSLPNMELSAADLDELSQGRFVLGLGSTTKEWNEKWHGVAYERPLQRMREYVEALRLLWTAGPQQPVTYDGECFTVDDYLRFNGPLERPVPIALGASRTGMARLAGEIADAVHFNACFSAAFIRDGLMPAVHDGAARAGRAQPPAVGSLTITAVDADAATARRWAAHQLAFYAGVADYFADLWRYHGLAEAHATVQERFRTGDVFGAVDAVPDEAVAAMTLAGTPDDVRRDLERYGDVVDYAIAYSPTFLLPPDVIKANHEAIIAALATS